MKIYEAPFEFSLPAEQALLRAYKLKTYDVDLEKTKNKRGKESIDTKQKIFTYVLVLLL